MTAAFIDRVSTKAQGLAPARVALTVLASPFYLLGLLVGVLWVAVAWAFAAAQIGAADVRDRAGRPDGDG